MGRTESAAIPLAAHCERDSGRWESNYFPVCRTVKVSPATAIVPVRDVVPVGRAATSYPTIPAPLPDFPERIVIHGALLTAVQPQPAGADTAISAAPPEPSSSTAP